MLVQIAGLLLMNECAAQDDWMYGPILIVCTVLSVGFGATLILAELFQAVAPERFEKIALKLRPTDKNISEGWRSASLRKSIVLRRPYVEKTRSSESETPPHFLTVERRCITAVEGSRSSSFASSVLSACAPLYIFTSGNFPSQSTGNR